MILFKKMQYMLIAVYFYIGGALGAIFRGETFGIQLSVPEITAITLLMLLLVGSYILSQILHEVGELNDKLAGRSDDMTESPLTKLIDMVSKNS